MNVVSIDDRCRPDPALVREFAEVARRMERDRTAATEYVGRLLRETPRREWPRLAECRVLYTSSALERLAAEVEARLDTAPMDALVLSAVAATIAEVLPSDAYPAIIRSQIRATAWTARAQALSRVQRYEEALNATSRAETLLGDFGSLSHDCAIAREVRASVLTKLGRVEDAICLLRECCRVFLDHGDTRRHLRCAQAEATLIVHSAHVVKPLLLDVAPTPIRNASDVTPFTRRPT